MKTQETMRASRLIEHHMVPQLDLATWAGMNLPDSCEIADGDAADLDAQIKPHSQVVGVFPEDFTEFKTDFEVMTLARAIVLLCGDHRLVDGLKAIIVTLNETNTTVYLSVPDDIGVLLRQRHAQQSNVTPFVRSK